MTIDFHFYNKFSIICTKKALDLIQFSTSKSEVFFNGRLSGVKILKNIKWKI